MQCVDGDVATDEHQNDQRLSSKPQDLWSFRCSLVATSPCIYTWSSFSSRPFSYQGFRTGQETGAPPLSWLATVCRTYGVVAGTGGRCRDDPAGADDLPRPGHGCCEFAAGRVAPILAVTATLPQTDARALHFHRKQRLAKVSADEGTHGVRDGVRAVAHPSATGHMDTERIESELRDVVPFLSMSYGAEVRKQVTCLPSAHLIGVV